MALRNEIVLLIPISQTDKMWERDLESLVEYPFVQLHCYEDNECYGSNRIITSIDEMHDLSELRLLRFVGGCLAVLWSPTLTVSTSPPKTAETLDEYLSLLPPSHLVSLSN